VNARHREIMRNMLKSEGITGYQAAERILPQIAEGRFWVSTHPETTQEFAHNRARHLAELSNPSLPPEVLAGLGVT